MADAAGGLALAWADMSTGAVAVQTVAAADLDLDGEQAMLLEETWKGFVRGGANLEPAQKEQLKALPGAKPPTP